MSDTTIRTPQTHPDDPVVGQVFKAWSIKHDKSTTYFCESYDPQVGYWMVNTEDPSDRRDVSERAIGRTYHQV